MTAQSSLRLDESVRVFEPADFGAPTIAAAKENGGGRVLARQSPGPWRRRDNGLPGRRERPGAAEPGKIRAAVAGAGRLPVGRLRGLAPRKNSARRPVQKAVRPRDERPRVGQVTIRRIRNPGPISADQRDMKTTAGRWLV